MKSPGLRGWMALSLGALLFCVCGTAWGKAPDSRSPEIKRDTRARVSSPKETVTLGDLIRELHDRNAALQAAQKAAEAKKAVISSAKTLPDPVFTFQTMGDLIPPDLQTGDPSSGRYYSIEQEIPFPGKLGLKGKIAESEAEAEGWVSEQTRRELVADLKVAYLDYLLLDKSIEIVEKDKGLLRSFTQVAESKYRVGEGNQQDVTKAQVELSKLLERDAVLGQRRTASEALINSLLLRPAGAPLGKPAALTKAELGLDLDQLTQTAQQNSAKLKTQEKVIDRSQHAVDLARKEFYPDFSLGFTYVERSDQKDMYGIMAKAKLPIYFWRKQGPDLDGAKLNLVSAQRSKDAIASTIAYNVRDAYTLATTSNRLVQLYGTAIIPQAKIALESAFAAYQVGTADFLSLVDSLVTLLEYELKYYESQTEYHKALVKLEPILGMELIN
jgi:outer membrane protein, heavy metal efflux system